MKLLAFNGSPRKKWNTATLLEHALKGAKSEGAKTELIHLYDLDYKGCTELLCLQADREQELRALRRKGRSPAGL